MSTAPKPSRNLRIDAVDFSFGEIVNLHTDREIIISPEYQRLFRWSDQQKSRLIESILVQLPIPPIFLVEDENGVLELIDGLQRVSSVIQFIQPEAINKDPLVLIGCDLDPDLNGKTYEGLPLAERLRIKRTPIRAIIIRREGNAYIKYELFKRLNTGGSLLSAQEIRNCSSRMVDGGDVFYDTLKSLAQDKNFKHSIMRLPESDLAEKGDEELVLRFFAVKNYIYGYSGNVKEWLDNYMEEILFENISFNTEEESKLFRDVFGVINKKFGPNAFARHKEGEAQGRLAPAYFEAVVGGLLPILDSVKTIPGPRLHATLAKAFESNEFKDVTGPGANTISKLKKRINLVTTAFRKLEKKP